MLDICFDLLAGGFHGEIALGSPVEGLGAEGKLVEGGDSVLSGAGGGPAR